MIDKSLFARFNQPPGARELRVGLEAGAAEIADHFNAALGSTDADLMAAAWSLFSAALEHALAGGTIHFVGGRADGLEVPVIQIVKTIVAQRRKHGEVRTD